MTMQALGDLAQSLVSRHQTSVLKQRMNRLTTELASGQTSDVTRHLKAGFGQLADIEHQLQVQQGYRTATAEAALFTSAMQNALGVVQDSIADLAGAAVLAASPADGITTGTLAVQARGTLDAVVAALNTGVAGRSLFAGTDAGAAPLAGADLLLSEARAAVGTAAGITGIRAALDTFFGPGGGFETAIYGGGTDNPAPYRLGAGESVQLSLRADDAAFREVLKSTIVASLADDPALNAVTRNALVDLAAKSLLTQGDQVTRIRADLGYAEERIERSSVRIATELTGLEYARGQLLSVDPFEAATELENVQFQLEALYTVTARAARLNLVNFLS